MSFLGETNYILNYILPLPSPSPPTPREIHLVTHLIKRFRWAPDNIHIGGFRSAVHVHGEGLAIKASVSRWSFR